MDKSGAVQCIYCQNSLPGCQIRCTACPPEFNFCVHCFSSGVEPGNHKSDHPYQIVDEQRLILFNTRPKTWNISEEERLLDAVDLYSIGNWSDVAAKVHTKSSEECQDHYYNHFLYGNIGRATFRSTQSPKKISDHTSQSNSSTKSPGSSAVITPPDLSVQDQQELGYMPLRDDFDKEYDDDAEKIVCNLPTSFEEDEIDRAYKLHQVQMYRMRQKERERRKKMGKDYDVLLSATSSGAKKILATRKKQSKDEKDMRERMKCYARFQKPADHESMLSVLMREKKVKTRVKELLKFRRNGIQKLADCAEYEAERLRREKKKELKKKIGGSTPRSSGLDDSSKGALAGKSENFNAGIELLSALEKKLCQSVGIKPAVYITIKTSIIKDHLQKRQGLPVKVRFPTQIEKSHRQTILNFFSDSGWIDVAG